MLGEKLVIKMWETIADKGIGSLLTPWQILRESDARTEARRREIILLAQAEKQAEDIKKGKCNILEADVINIPNIEKRIEPTFEIENLVKQAESKNIEDHIREEININKAVIYAEDELAGSSQEPPEKSVDDDWLYRWKENASKVSAEELQQIWGKVLAGEIKSPGKYSLRTLEFLKNISQKEASLIEKVAQFNISGCISRDEEEILTKNGLSFGSFILLQELGIIHGVESTAIIVKYCSDIEDLFQKVLLSNGKALLITHEDATKKITIKAYGITTLGKQVLSLGSFNNNEEYLISIGEKIIKDGFEVKIGDWQQIDDGHGRIFNTAEIAEKNI